MAALAPSLKGLFASIDFLWPRRNHGIDGWYRSPAQGHSIGHNPGHNGYSHAIDVDVRGINPPWIIDHLNRRSDVMWYIIWDVRVWSNDTGWNGHHYVIPPGGSDHRNHMHIEIRQTSFAEGFTGPWFGNGGGSVTPPGAGGGGEWGNAGLSAADPRDFRDHVYDMGHGSAYGYGGLTSATGVIRNTRNL